ncbi:MAG: GNAT family N-acetyltransferase [Planctomycetaceae bacterium]|nr:GNAT family N-acetyltransferase [Planctomycetaceae bacterium]
MIAYRDDVVPPVESIIELYHAAPLNRPIEDRRRIAAMYAGSNLVYTAWEGDRLAGIVRAWSDGARDGYICDLAIHPDYQRLGIGRELLDRVVASNRQVQFVLRASEIARDYYRHIGWEFIENGWFVPRQE